MSINKVVYGGETLIDLTGDTVTADKLLSGITAHGKDGELVTGACTFDVDSNDATAAVAEILKRQNRLRKRYKACRNDAKQWSCDRLYQDLDRQLCDCTGLP